MALWLGAPRKFSLSGNIIHINFVYHITHFLCAIVHHIYMSLLNAHVPRILGTNEKKMRHELSYTHFIRIAYFVSRSMRVFTQLWIESIHSKEERANKWIQELITRILFSEKVKCKYRFRTVTITSLSKNSIENFIGISYLNIYENNEKKRTALKYSLMKSKIIGINP